MFYIGEHLSFIHQNLNEGLILANSWKILLAERKISRYFQGGGGWSVAYLLLGKVICLWHIINIPPKTTTCDKTKDSLRRLKVNFKKIFKLLLRILLHQTVQLELSNLDNRLQFSFWLGTNPRKLATNHQRNSKILQSFCMKAITSLDQIHYTSYSALVFNNTEHTRKDLL